ncbi:hypothetical protein HYDPIDRAFT_117454 [Hydnomerulius pinastri MD-312]|uniref:Uncharacterized protein n=1 Tax=Hydnomerulius pinastri MD-312 TaxID=994086 RepID=A0A0C9W2K9_9AGAM|nr:hypothetical protein HYDPIDRAFT_117454 [Hydnomerulius pinastri MD-312]
MSMRHPGASVHTLGRLEGSWKVGNEGEGEIESEQQVHSLGIQFQPQWAAQLVPHSLGSVPFDGTQSALCSRSHIKLAF